MPEGFKPRIEPPPRPKPGRRRRDVKGVPYTPELKDWLDAQPPFVPEPEDQQTQFPNLTPEQQEELNRIYDETNRKIARGK